MSNRERNIKRDIIKALHKAQRFINNQDSKQLKILSDFTIRNAMVYQDNDSLSVAVIIYAFSKLLERWGFDTEYADQARNLLGSAEFSLEEGRLDEYRDKMKKVFEFTASTDKEFRVYLDHVIDKAQVKKGSRLYEHGLSISQAANLMGIGQWELMSYVGKTRINEEDVTDDSVGSRMEFARSLFR